MPRQLEITQTRRHIKHGSAISYPGHRSLVQPLESLMRPQTSLVNASRRCSLCLQALTRTHSACEERTARSMVQLFGHDVLQCHPVSFILWAIGYVVIICNVCMQVSTSKAGSGCAAAKIHARGSSYINKYKCLSFGGISACLRSP